RRGGVAGQELLDARDVEAEQVSAYVVLVGVGDEHAAELHAVGLHGVDDAVDVPRRIDHHALTSRRIPDQIHEVLHRAQLHLLEVDGVAHWSQNPSTHTSW